MESASLLLFVVDAIRALRSSRYFFVSLAISYIQALQSSFSPSFLIINATGILMVYKTIGEANGGRDGVVDDDDVGGLSRAAVTLSV